MVRFPRIVLAAAVGCVVGAVSPAPAQFGFGPSARYNFQFGMAPNVMYNPFLPILPTVPGRYSLGTYTLSGWGANGPYSINYQYYRNGAVRVAPFAGGGYASGMGTLVDNSRAAERQRSAVAAAQRGAKYDVSPAVGSTNTQDFDKWLREQAGRRENRDPAAGPVIDPTLINPPAEAILSGDVLNTLAGLIAELEGKGKRADAGLCPPELMTKVVFDGPGAEAANQFRTSELVFPEPLRADAFADMRAGLERAYAPVASAAHSGKKVVPTDADKLLAEVARARQAAAPLVKEAGVDDARAVSVFFNRLESAAKAVKEANSAGIAGVRWSQFGATTSDLAKHMTKYKLHFARPASGDEGAYQSLHRGLLAYYAGLLQAK